MLFGWKNPLKKKLSSEDLHRAREEFEKAHGAAGNFIGASLVDRAAWMLPSFAEKRAAFYHVSGSYDTFVNLIPTLLSREAMEQHKSILFVDFGSAEKHDGEPVWWRFWALSFYLDRARAFRLFDLNHPERSDTLGAALPETFKNIFPHLAPQEQAVNPAQYLKNEKGMVIFSTDLRGQNETALIAQLALSALPAADLILLHHFDALSREEQENFLKSWQQITATNPQKHSLVIHEGAYNSNLDEKLASASIMFRQRNPLPENQLLKIKNAAPSNVAKALNELNANLEAFEAVQALAVTSEKVDLIQISDSDGLPWPPEYRPLRSRHAGT